MPPRSKPANLTIVAILNVIIALPCVCCMGFTAIGAASMGDAGVNQPKPAANDPFGEAMFKMNEQANFIAKEAPGYKAEQLAYSVVVLLCSIGLLISAIGLFMGQQWGRMLSIAACAVMIVAALGNTVYTVIYVMPATKKFEEQHVAKQAGPPPPKGAQEAGGLVAVCVALLIGAGYPAVAIAML